MALLIAVICSLTREINREKRDLLPWLVSMARLLARRTAVARKRFTPTAFKMAQKRTALRPRTRVFDPG